MSETLLNKVTQLVGMLAMVLDLDAIPFPFAEGLDEAVADILQELELVEHPICTRETCIDYATETILQDLMQTAKETQPELLALVKLLCDQVDIYRAQRQAIKQIKQAKLN